MMISVFSKIIPPLLSILKKDTLFPAIKSLSNNKEEEIKKPPFINLISMGSLNLYVPFWLNFKPKLKRSKNFTLKIKKTKREKEIKRKFIKDVKIVTQDRIFTCSYLGSILVKNAEVINLKMSSLMRKKESESINLMK